MWMHVDILKGAPLDRFNISSVRSGCERGILVHSSGQSSATRRQRVHTCVILIHFNFGVPGTGSGTTNLKMVERISGGSRAVMVRVL